MTATISGICIVGNQLQPIHIEQWLPGHCNVEGLVVAINPHPSLREKIADSTIQYQRYRGFECFFRPPPGVRLKQAHRWQSKSIDPVTRKLLSDAHYPWDWYCWNTFSNLPVVIACQLFLGPGWTSEHYHKGTIEKFSSGHNDGHTKLYVEGESDTTIPSEHCRTVPIETSHQIIRDRPGVSIQFLRMKSMRGYPMYPSRKDHIFCRRLHFQK